MVGEFVDDGVYLRGRIVVEPYQCLIGWFMPEAGSGVWDRISTPHIFTTTSLSFHVLLLWTYHRDSYSVHPPLEFKVEDIPC